MQLKLIDLPAREAIQHHGRAMLRAGHQPVVTAGVNNGAED
jgi:hypothetical protein